MTKGVLFLTMGALTLAAGCSRPPPPAFGMPDSATINLRGQIPSNARFVLRVPRVAENVSETGSEAKWDELEKGLYESDLEVVDRGLLEQLLRSNTMPSYDEIRARTGADIIIEILDVQYELENLHDSEYACEKSTVTAKLINVADGAVMGTVAPTMSSCPVTESEEDQRKWLFRCWDFTLGSAVTDVYDGAGGGCPGAQWVLKTAPHAWVQTGKKLAEVLSSQMTLPPIERQASAPGEPSPTPTIDSAASQPSAPPPSTGGAQPTSLEARLEKLKQLRESGVITEAEYKKMREQVISEF